MVVRPLPGEFILGHLGRWQKLLGRNRPEDALDHLRHIYPPTTASAVPGVCHLAAASQSNVQEYVQSHTLVPFDCFCATDSILEQTGGLITGALDKFTMQRSAPALLCPRCIEEDLQQHGVSYWHRSHQIPGHFWCSNHSTTKLHVCSAGLPYQELPHHWLQLSLTKPIDIDTSTKGNRNYQRYLSACELMLMRRSPLDNGQIMKALTAAAVSYGISTSAGGTAPKTKMTLAELSINLVGIAPTINLFPSIDPQNLKCIRYGVDNIFSVPVHGSSAVAMSIALLAPKLLSPTCGSLDARDLNALAHESADIKSHFLEAEGNIEQLSVRWNVGSLLAVRRVKQALPEIMAYFDGLPEMQAMNDFWSGMALAQACQKAAADPNLVERLIWLHMRQPDQAP